MLFFDERILFCLAVLVWCIKEGTSQMPDHGPMGRTISRAALFALGVAQHLDEKVGGLLP